MSKKATTLISLVEAASIAGVTTSSLYYHVFKSHKLQPHWKFNDKDRLAIYVSRDNLKELYPAVKAGTKQKLSNTRYPVSFEDWKIRLSSLKGQIERSRKEERKAALQAKYLRLAMKMVDAI